MDSQQAGAWFHIAQKVNALLAFPGARDRFRQRVEEAAAEWLQRSDEKAQREDARREALKRQGVPHRSGRLPPAPQDGSFHWLEAIPDESGDRSPLEAWLPAALSPDRDPDDSLPLPVPAGQEVSLAERYAVLAAVWDAHWKGDEKIVPGADDEFSPKANWYWCLVHAGDPAFSATGLSDQDAAIVGAWIEDVETHLAAGKPTGGKPAARSTSRPTGRPPGRDRGTVAARMAILVHNDPSVFDWTARKFAVKLGCSPSTVVDAPVWKNLQGVRETLRWEASQRAHDKGSDVAVDKRRLPKRYPPRRAERQHD